MTSEKFDFLVSGELLFASLGFALLCSRYFVEGTEMQPHRPASDLPLLISENLSEMSNQGFQL